MHLELPDEYIDKKDVKTMKIEVDIWDMKDGMITAVKHDGKILRVKQEPDVSNISEVLPYVIKSIPHKRTKNFIDMWIQKNHVKEFKVDMFLQANPTRKYEKSRISFYLSKMIEDKTLTQTSNDTFIVNKKI